MGKILPICSIAFATLISSVVHAQQDTQQVEARVNGILSQMTLAEKLDYISGISLICKQ